MEDIVMSKVNFTDLTTKNLGALVLRILEKVQRSEIKGIEKNKFLIELKSISEEYQQSLTKRTGSNITATIEALDAERDRFVVRLRRKLDYFIISDKPEEVQAAEKLSKVFGKFASGIERLSYSKETQAIITFLSELRKSDYETEIKLLDMIEMINLLEDKNKEFEKIFATRDSDFIATNKTQSAGNIRKALQEALTKFLSYVSAMVQTTEASEWVSLEAECNQTIANIFASEDKKQSKPDTEPTEDVK